MKNLLINRALAAKKMKLFTLLLAVAASVGTMFASNTQVDGIWYDFDSSSKTASVTFRGSRVDSYSNEYTNSVVIPSSVTYNSVSYSVTSIGDDAFYRCTSLTSVTIPNSVTSIGAYAFDYCTGLSSVTIGNSVTEIGNFAFHNCSSLTSVTIPNSVTSIGRGAFGGCTGLTSVTIPNSVTSIGRSAFDACSGLTSVTIPNSVTSIGDYAFCNCPGLSSVTLGNSVTEIGNDAFSLCTGLTSMTIPNSVTSIGDYAFYGCSGLTSVTINSDGIVSKKYTYSSSIENIFGSQVIEYIIGEDVTSIGDNAFCNCSGLTSVSIPNSVTSIGSGAFYKCTGLTSVTIPNSVTSIGDYAFHNCSSLTSVTIPNSVTSIGNYAFLYCSGLTSVTIEAETPPTLYGSAFKNTNNCPIYVPCNAVNAYKTKTAWSNYADRIRGNCASYTITFKNWDGSVLQSTQVEEGQMPQYTGATPTKPSDSQYSYTFSGWTPQIVAATADATYTATYTPRSQGVEEVLSDQVQCTKVVRNGQIYILRGDKTYTLQGQEIIVP